MSGEPHPLIVEVDMTLHGAWWKGGKYGLQTMARTALVACQGWKKPSHCHGGCQLLIGPNILRGTETAWAEGSPGVHKGLLMKASSGQDKAIWSLPPFTWAALRVQPPSSTTLLFQMCRSGPKDGGHVPTKDIHQWLWGKSARRGAKMGGTIWTAGRHKLFLHIHSSCCLHVVQNIYTLPFTSQNSL